MDVCNPTTPVDKDDANFCCIFASSGTGKTQLAVTASLYHRGGVIYLFVSSDNAKSDLQPFYQPHFDLCQDLYNSITDFWPKKETTSAIASDIDSLERTNSDRTTALSVLLGRIFFPDDPPEGILALRNRLRTASANDKPLVFLDEIPQRGRIVCLYLDNRCDFAICFAHLASAPSS